MHSLRAKAVLCPGLKMKFQNEETGEKQEWLYQGGPNEYLIEELKLNKVDLKGNNVVLFGSEGYGLKYQTLKNSDFLLKISIDKKIESLNISNSAAIVLHHINKIFNGVKLK